MDTNEELTPKERELRDVFAGQALVALLGSNVELPTEDAQLVAVAAYTMAGLMVAERRRRLTPDEQNDHRLALRYYSETRSTGVRHGGA